MAEPELGTWATPEDPKIEDLPRRRSLIIPEQALVFRAWRRPLDVALEDLQQRRAFPFGALDVFIFKVSSARPEFQIEDLQQRRLLPLGALLVPVPFIFRALNRWRAADHMIDDGPTQRRIFPFVALLLSRGGFARVYYRTQSARARVEE